MEHMGYVHTGCGLRNLTLPPELSGAFQACQQLASLCDNEAGMRTDPARAGVSILPTCKEWSGAYDVSGLYSYRSL